MINTLSFKKLVKHYKQMQSLTLKELFKADDNRFNKFSLTVNEILFDFSKNNITDETINYLVAMANESGLHEQIHAMFQGDKINNTENRAALHTALRSNQQSIYVNGANVMADIKQVLMQMQEFSQNVHLGKHVGYTGKVITDIVNIGIGGSDLGPSLVCKALKPYSKNNLKIHFISSADGYQINEVLANLNPETTLFIIASKTFTTQETLVNANTARTWFLAHALNHKAVKQHFVAVSTNLQAVEQFGIDPKNMFQFWDFVGGRYSLWSAIGLSIVLYIGYANFSQLLAGARAMDEHFFSTLDFTKNLPVILALISIWYINFYNYTTQVISPYNTQLAKLPAYIQQLEMESNGKSVAKNGNQLTYKTCPVIWGDSGINAQHAYYQLLHQGTSIYPMDIIISLSSQSSDKQHNDILVANAIAQAEAFMLGKAYPQAVEELLALGVPRNQAKFLAKHKIFSGNRPTNMLVLPEISPYFLGNLIALYEHKVFTQGVIWQINSFDQMGVELGKQLTKTILTDITTNQVSLHDSSTTSLIQLYLKAKHHKASH